MEANNMAAMHEALSDALNARQREEEAKENKEDNDNNHKTAPQQQMGVSDDHNA